MIDRNEPEQLEGLLVERLGTLIELTFLNVFHGVFDIAWRGHPGGSLAFASTINS
jgi:hypothetical protein